MRSQRTILLGCLGIAMAVGSAVRAGTYVPVIPVAGSSEGSTGVLGINDDNVIVGSYFTDDGVQHGFTGTLDGNYTTFDIGVTVTDARGIGKDGSITGEADDRDGNFFPFERLPNGSVKKITIDGQRFAFGLAQGFNSKGVFVGFGETEKDFERHQFYAKKGKYQGEIASGLGEVNTKGVDSLDNVVGDYFTSGDQREHGAFLQDGTASTIDFPGANVVDTFLDGLNDNGIAAGEWDNGFDAQKYKFFGFMVDLNSATFTQLAPPHAKFSQAWGVNKNGLIAITSDQGAFIYCPKKKKCPAAGINVAGPKPIQISSFRLFKKGETGVRRPGGERATSGKHHPLWWRMP
jgi:hypothetical protein